MKALVLEGCTGLLGQALRHVLLGRGWSVESLERSDGDILDADFLQARLDSCAPDVVFSSLGWNTVDDAEDHSDEVLLYNRTLPHTLACLLKTRGEGHLVHFSSGLVFSGQHGSPWREEDATAPLNVYGKTRLAGEQAVLQTLPERACVVRTGWLFGPGKRNFVDDILNACHRRDSITIVDDRTGSPTYSLDLALWSIMLAERQATGLWHAVNSGQATWCELACEAHPFVAMAAKSAASALYGTGLRQAFRVSGDASAPLDTGPAGAFFLRPVRCLRVSGTGSGRSPTRSRVRRRGEELRARDAPAGRRWQRGIDLERLFTACGSTAFLCRIRDAKPSIARGMTYFRTCMVWT